MLQKPERKKKTKYRFIDPATLAYDCEET